MRGAVQTCHENALTGWWRQWLFIAEYTYGTLLATIKWSILAMYYRLFPTKFTGRGVIIVGCLTAAWWIAVILVTTFQCRPISKVWIPAVRGECINKNDIFLGGSVPNIAT